MSAANGFAAAGLSQDGARAPYACHPGQSRGRFHAEPESANRSVFQRDRDRIIHSAAFRRLKYKTQVFVFHEGDYFRTRLTHSLEVAQVARSCSRTLGLDEDLAEALALAHDLGHTPFGHAGEEVLSQEMEPYGGFDHNGQALRILTRLEARYAEFDGLNLTWETLEGVTKHNGPLVSKAGDTEGLPWAVAEHAREQDLELHTWPGLEAQVAALADDIAYNSHDIDDGLRAGLFTVDHMADVDLVGPIIGELRSRYPDLEKSRLIHETTRRLINTMIEDLITETRRRLRDANPQSAAEIRAQGQAVAALSEEMVNKNNSLQEFLHQRMYHHYRVNRMTSKARRVVSDLFGLFLDEPECLPTSWRAMVEGAPETARARQVADYIAGMTDRYALDEHRRLFDLYE